jgi:hypothetical protein
MCDYSLEMVASRPAVVGEKLVVTRFKTATTGFAAPGDAETAVCVLPGTELAFDANITERPFYAWECAGAEAKTHEYAVGVFTQIDTEVTFRHHDAFKLPNDVCVRLNDIVPGQTATVLQLPKSGIDELPGQSVMDHIELPADCEASAPAPLEMAVI